jgi:hypothetical protein
MVVGMFARVFAHLMATRTQRETRNVQGTSSVTYFLLLGSTSYSFHHLTKYYHQLETKLLIQDPVETFHIQIITMILTSTSLTLPGNVSGIHFLQYEQRTLDFGSRIK